jgi:hypothetical protein
MEATLFLEAHRVRVDVDEAVLRCQVAPAAREPQALSVEGASHEEVVAFADGDRSRTVARMSPAGRDQPF